MEKNDLYPFKIKVAGNTVNALLEVGKKGFTLWVNEEVGHNKVARHWVLDASCLCDDGTVRVCHPNDTWGIGFKKRLTERWSGTEVQTLVDGKKSRKKRGRSA